jgi:hypothetical protein
MMAERLKQAFALAGQRSEEEQQVLAKLVFQELQVSARWEALFADPRSDKFLEQLVNEALAEDDTGETEEITGDSFL